MKILIGIILFNFWLALVGRKLAEEQQENDKNYNK